MTADPASPERPSLSRERILHAAMRIADVDGLDALSMRRLGAALGVEAMSLYHHVASKDALLDGITDLALADVDLPAPGGDWRAGVRTIARSTHDALMRHPWAATLMLSRTIPSRFRYMEALLGHLRTGGLSVAQTRTLPGSRCGGSAWRSTSRTCRTSLGPSSQHSTRSTTPT